MPSSWRVGLTAQDGEAHFVPDFVQAWVKVMELDRFDLKYNEAA